MQQNNNPPMNMQESSINDAPADASSGDVYRDIETLK